MAKKIKNTTDSITIHCMLEGGVFLLYKNKKINTPTKYAWFFGPKNTNVIFLKQKILFTVEWATVKHAHQLVF